MIRPATEHDLPRLLEIYASAKHFMHTHGNPTQWNGSYPDEETLRNDVKHGQLFVQTDEEGIYACFALIGGEDPTYGYIEGEWRSSSPYGTIHRIASSRRKRGVFAECTAFARTRYDHLRVDTHADNLPMQGAVQKEGFSFAGIIYLADGSPRRAYEWIRE